MISNEKWEEAEEAEDGGDGRVWGGERRKEEEEEEEEEEEVGAASALLILLWSVQNSCRLKCGKMEMRRVNSISHLHTSSALLPLRFNWLLRAVLLSISLWWNDWMFVDWSDCHRIWFFQLECEDRLNIALIGNISECVRVQFRHWRDVRWDFRQLFKCFVHLIPD